MPNRYVLTIVNTQTNTAETVCYAFKEDVVTRLEALHPPPHIVWFLNDLLDRDSMNCWP